MTKPGNVRRNTSRRSTEEQRAYTRAWMTLSTAITEALDDGLGVGCVSMPRLYTQRRVSKRDPQARLEATFRDRLCNACPVRQQCDDYAEIVTIQRIRVTGYLPDRRKNAA